MAEESKSNFGFEAVTSEKDLAESKKHQTNGVHKYLKKYLLAYRWQDREEIIKKYAELKNFNDKKIKDLCVHIQDNFKDFIKFLKENYKPFKKKKD